MDSPLDLYRASREDLIALILAQREQIAALEQELGRVRAALARQQADVARLTARVGELLAALAPADGDEAGLRPTTMPGLKAVGKGRAAPPPRPPRRHRAHGSGRKRLPPTARQVHAVSHCPPCRTPLRGGPHKRRREVLELMPAPVALTEHV